MAEDTQSRLSRITINKYSNEATDMVRGTAEFIPDPHISMGKVYTLKGLGAFFSGNYYTVSVTHTFNNSGYRQQAELIKQQWDGIADVTVETPPTPRPSKSPTTPKSTQRVHIVTSDDTLWSISKKYYSSGTYWATIEKINHEQLVQRDHRNSDGSGHWIYAGMKLIIP